MPDHEGRLTLGDLEPGETFYFAGDHYAPRGVHQKLNGVLIYHIEAAEAYPFPLPTMLVSRTVWHWPLRAHA